MKHSSLSVYFLGDYKLKITEIPYTVIQAYSLYFYVISKTLVASYASIAKLKMMFQKNLVSQQIYVSKGLISALLHAFCDVISLQIFKINILSIEESCNSISF